MKNKERIDRLNGRLARLKALMAESGFDGLLVSKTENQIYLCDFPFEDSCLLITQDKNYMLTDFRYMEAAAEACPMYELVKLTENLSEGEFIESLKLPCLATENGTLTVNMYEQLKKDLTLTELADATDLIDKMRMIKDAYEIDCITKAVDLTDACFTHMLDFIKVGMTEKQVALEIELFFKKNGAERLSFDTICVSGVRTSLPHGVPTDKKLESGDFVTLDFGCVINGYCSDMTRTIALGSVTDEQRKVYGIVLAAQQAGIDGLKSGLTYLEADMLARKVIQDAGYGDYFGHSMGHGVGLEIHENPTVGPRGGHGYLKEGMAVTIEPGIYLPKKFGVRIEDLAIITSSGIIDKVHSTKELIIL